MVVLTLALGIGANTAIFTLMDQVLLRVLPVKDPERLVVLDAPGPNSGSVHNQSMSLTPLSYPMYVDLRDKADVFEGVLAHWRTAVHLGYKGATEQADADLVSGNFFDVLGVPAALGRVFGADDDRTPAPIRSWSWATASGSAASGPTPRSSARPCRSTAGP